MYSKKLISALSCLGNDGDKGPSWFIDHKITFSIQTTRGKKISTAKILSIDYYPDANESEIYLEVCISGFTQNDGYKTVERRLVVKQKGDEFEIYLWEMDQNVKDFETFPLSVISLLS